MDSKNQDEITKAEKLNERIEAEKNADETANGKDAAKKIDLSNPHVTHEETMAKVDKFRNDRNWRQFHNEKDLALSISLEASELLEIFQWKTADEGLEDFEHLKEELADVFIYSYMMASNLNLDVDKIIEEKLAKNEQKYPIGKSLGKKQKYDEL